MTTTTAKTRTAKVKHPLESHIPEKYFAEDYVSRIVNGVNDMDILAAAKEDYQNTLIFGPTGPGKTSFVYAYAARSNLPLLPVQCHGSADARELFGSWVPTEVPGQLIWQDGVVTQIVRHGGVIYLDEVNFMPPRVLAVLHGLLDKRRSITLMEHGGETIVGHNDTQIIASYNPDYEDTRPLNKAFRNRFAFKLFWDYEPAVEKKLVNSPMLRGLAKSLRDRADDIETPVTTNMLQELEVFAQNEKLGSAFAIENFLNSFSDDERQGVSLTIDALGDEFVAEIEGYLP